MRCIDAAYVVMRCPSVRLSVTFVSCVKTNKDIFAIFTLSGSQAILVFPCQTGWRYSDGNPPNGGVECRWGRQKRDSERISLHIKPRTSASVEPSTHGGVRRRSSYKTRTNCDGLDVIRRRRRSNSPPDTTPLVITTFSAAVGQDRTRRVFLSKTDTNPYS